VPRLRVLLDGRVDGADGIGRCTRSIIAALRTRHTELDLRVLAPTGTLTYSRRAGAELVAAARRERAQIVHTLDYRIGVDSVEVLPLVVTVHDVLRIAHPEFGYPDQAFAERFGAPAFHELAATVEQLRRCVDFPLSRPPLSTHYEYLGRMLALAVGRAQLILTPTQSVARQLADVMPSADAATRVLNWGVDHLVGHSDGVARRLPRPYVLYVGQARSHKGFPELLEAVARSATVHHGADLVLAGRDFTADAAATVEAQHTLGVARVHRIGRSVGC
jgi:glycosyltransferase involved in cell wall biosynthesis